MAREKKKSKKWIIIVVVVIIIIAAAASSGGGDSDSNPKKVSSGNNSSSEDKKTDAEETTLQTTFAKGDVLETEDLRVTFMDCGEYTDYNEYSAPAKGNKIVYAEFEFENISDTDQYVSSFDFSCYADGYDCGSYYLADKESLDATLSAGKKTKGQVLFEVPKDAGEVQLEYEVNYWTSDKIVFTIQ